jgi:putative FmdB family regulatory protein
VPTYAYACTSCGHRFEAQQSFSDAALTECPECAGRLRKLFTNVGIVFKGSGFYRTDSRAGAGSGSSEKVDAGSKSDSTASTAASNGSAGSKESSSGSKGSSSAPNGSSSGSKESSSSGSAGASSGSGKPAPSAA